MNNASMKSGVEEVKPVVEVFDGKQLGLKCGLEIHAQLEGSKLFCSCPTRIREEAPHFVFQRKLRAAAGETGEVDVAAKAEMAKDKHNLYEGYDNSTCLVEMDECPPGVLSAYCLTAALQVAKLSGMRVVDEVHVMRKTVVDGSNTSGFQRTALVARDGSIPTKNGPVRLATLCVEEDSCRTIVQKEDHTVYRLDRLGIPLLEIATEADIQSPEQCAEAAERIGLLVRSTGASKRGLGTIRQDVNVSISHGSRVEIKGAQDLAMVPAMVKIEALRQKGLLEIKKELQTRNHPLPSLVPIDLTLLLGTCSSKVVQDCVRGGGVILGMTLPGFAGLLGRELQPGRRLGTEFSEHAKVHAGVGGIFHSDELPKYGITAEDVERVKNTLQVGPHDGFVLVAAGKHRAMKALDAVFLRAKQVYVGVPREVRGPNVDGTTSYQRPMPGAARMYPETDVPTIAITKDVLGKVALPELVEDRQERYEQLGLARDLAVLAARSEEWKAFDALVASNSTLKPAYIAEVLFTSVKTIKRQFNVDVSPSHEDFTVLFTALGNGQLSKESVIELLKQGLPVTELLKKYELIGDDELAVAVKRIVEQKKGMPLNAVLGAAMAELRGKAEGRKVAELIKKLVG